MPRKLETCYSCGQKFKLVNKHVKFCKARKRLDEARLAQAPSIQAGLIDTSYNRTLELQKQAAENMRNQAKNSLVAFMESVTKLSMALAQVIGEWRF